MFENVTEYSATQFLQQAVFPGNVKVLKVLIPFFIALVIY